MQFNLIRRKDIEIKKIFGNGAKKNGLAGMVL